MTIEVHRLDAARRADFFRLLGEPSGGGCFRAAWWVPTWDGWGERTADENRRLREALLARGEHDSYLLYVDGAPLGWCQVGPRDRLAKLVAQDGLAADAEAWAITCFQITPAHRRRGLAGRLLGAVLDDLAARGVRRVEAFPKRGASDEGELWNGAEAMFRAAGFASVAEASRGPVLRRALDADPQSRGPLGRLATEPRFGAAGLRTG